MRGSSHTMLTISPVYEFSIKMTSIFADMNEYIKLVPLYTVCICSKYRNLRTKTSLCSVNSSN